MVVVEGKAGKNEFLMFFIFVSCLVAEAAADSSFDGGSMALAIFILVLLVFVLLGGAYIYVTRWAIYCVKC